MSETNESNLGGIENTSAGGDTVPVDIDGYDTSAGTTFEEITEAVNGDAPSLAEWTTDDLVDGDTDAPDTQRTDQANPAATDEAAPKADPDTSESDSPKEAQPSKADGPSGEMEFTWRGNQTDTGIYDGYDLPATQHINVLGEVVEYEGGSNDSPGSATDAVEESPKINTTNDTDTSESSQATDEADVENTVSVMEDAAAADKAQEEPSTLTPLPTAKIESPVATEDTDTPQSEDPKITVTDHDAKVYESLALPPESQPDPDMAEKIAAIQDATIDHAADLGFDAGGRITDGQVHIFDPETWGEVLNKTEAAGAVPLNRGDQTVGVHVVASGDVLVLNDPDPTTTLQTVQVGLTRNLAERGFASTTVTVEDITTTALQLTSHGYAEASPDIPIGEYAMLTNYVASAAAHETITQQWQTDPRLTDNATAATLTPLSDAEKTGGQIVDIITSDRMPENGGITFATTRADTISLLEKGSMVGDKTVVRELLEQSFGEEGAAIIADWGRPGGCTNQELIEQLDAIRTQRAEDLRAFNNAMNLSATVVGNQTELNDSEDAEPSVPVLEITEQDIIDAVNAMHDMSDNEASAESAGDSDSGQVATVPTATPFGAYNRDVAPTERQESSELTVSTETDDSGIAGFRETLSPEAESWLRQTAEELGIANPDIVSTQVLGLMITEVIQEQLDAGVGVGNNSREGQSGLIVDIEEVRFFAERHFEAGATFEGPLADALRDSIVRTAERTAKGLVTDAPGGGQASAEYHETGEGKAPVILGTGRKPEAPSESQQKYDDAKTQQAANQSPPRSRETGRQERSDWANTHKQNTGSPSQVHRDAARRSAVSILVSGQLTRSQWASLRPHIMRWGWDGQRQPVAEEALALRIIGFILGDISYR
jgi:hypothetical protein